MTDSIDEDFKIVFDPSAMVALGGKTLDMEEKIRREILDLFRADPADDGPSSLADLAFHVVDHGGPQPFICEPFEDTNETTGILVRAAIYKSLGALDEGPFKGREVMMPQGEDDEDDLS